MEKDILIRVQHEFGQNSIEALQLLDKFESKALLSPRVTRCIVVLSKGNIENLKLVIEEAYEDWRDVIDEAETFDFEFNQPFTN